MIARARSAASMKVRSRRVRTLGSMLGWGIVVSLALQGCTLFHPIGPDYRHPDAPGASGPGAASAAGVDASLVTDRQVFSPEPVPGPWWQLYNDPALNELVNEALTANRDLRVAAAHLEGSRSALDAARAAWLPSTSLDVADERERSTTPGVVGLHRKNAALVNLDISYEVDLFGRIRRTVEAAHATLDAQQFAFAAAQVQVVANTVSAYALACQDNVLLATLQHQLTLAEQQADVTRRLAAHGAATDVDVTRAEAAVETQQASLPTAQGQRQSALYSLAVLLGRPPTQYPAAAANCSALPQLAQPMPVGDGMALLRRRPDVAQAERTLAGATAEIGVSMAAMYPQVSLGVGVGGEGTSLSGAMRATGRTWDFGPMVHWTFPNIVIARAQVREQEAVANADLASYDSTVLTALKEADSALDGYARALEHDAALRQARDADEKAYRQTQRLYDNGALPFVDVLDAQQTLLSAEQQLVSAAGTIASDQVQVFQALGGGWTDAAQRAAVQAQAAARRFQEEAVASKACTSACATGLPNQ